MAAVGDLPPSDGEDDDDEEEESEEEDEEEEEEEEEGEAAPEKTQPSEPETEEQIRARMEAIRLHRALGNDSDDGLDQDSDAETDSSSGSDTDSESDDGSENGSIAAQTDYTAYTRAPRPPKQRVPAKKLGQRDLVKQTIEGELKAQGGGKGKSGGGRNKIGRAKGHKWKSNPDYLVGKNSAW